MATTDLRRRKLVSCVTVMVLSAASAGCGDGPGAASQGTGAASSIGGTPNVAGTATSGGVANGTGIAGASGATTAGTTGGGSTGEIAVGASGGSGGSIPIPHEVGECDGVWTSPETDGLNWELMPDSPTHSDGCTMDPRTFDNDHHVLYLSCAGDGMWRMRTE
jgi:hypothetical protein